MRVLVLGGAGFVGRHVVEALLRDGHDVLASDQAPDPYAGKVPYAQADLLEEGAAARLVQDKEAVVHLAAHPLGPSVQQPLLNARVNIEGTLRVLDAARAAGARSVVFASASSLVGEVLRDPVDEAHPATPKTPYGVAKLAVEQYLRVYGELYGLSWLAFRFFNVYGPGQLPASRALVPLVYERLASGRPVTVFGDGSSVRDYVYVGDVAGFFAQALRGPAPNEVLNMGTGRGATVLDVARAGARVLGVEARFDFQPQRPGEIANFTADTRRLRARFGRVPETTLDEGLERTFRWLREHAPPAAPGGRA